jgi:hypothetical protein
MQKPKQNPPVWMPQAPNNLLLRHLEAYVPIALPMHRSTLKHSNIQANDTA